MNLLLLGSWNTDENGISDEMLKVQHIKVLQSIYV